MALSLLIVAALGAGVGCAAEESSIGGDDAASPRGSAGVGQSGSQDFGRFRGIIDDGQIPAPETLDPVGFFNEHKIELPPADCGEQICLHGLLGVQGNMINGSNCTIALIGFNTPLDPDDYERPPLNMAIAVDVSGSMAGTPMNSVRSGLLRLADELDPKDTVTLVTYATDAEIVLDSTPQNDPQRAALKEAIAGLQASGDTNLFEGLRLALEAVDARRESNRQNRVVFLSDGVATSGIVDRDRTARMASVYASKGIGITTIGVGTEFDMSLMSRLAESGAGNFYFLENVGAVEEVFTEEIKTFMVPLGEDVRIDLSTHDAYRFRAAYGTRLWEADEDGVRIEIPSLFMASRETIDDVAPGGGRRGGGGAILVELVPESDEAIIESTGPGAEAASIQMTYRKPGTDIEVAQAVAVTNPLRPGETPGEGEFQSKSVEKAFVALNIYAGFQMAVQRADQGSFNSALNVLRPLAENVEEWLQDNPDVDIEGDLETMHKLITILENQGATEEVGAPPDPWPRD